MSITTNKKPFIPDAVFIPSDQNDEVDSDACIKLMVDGNNNSADVFTEESWINDGEPFCRRELGQFTHIDAGRVELLPEVWIVKIDERDCWLDQDVLVTCSRIYDVYVFDRRKHFHLCSFTPCYELHFLGIQYEESPDLLDDEYRRDEINSKVLEGDLLTEQVTYWSSATIDRMIETEIVQGCLPPKFSNGGYQLLGIESVTVEQVIEEALEAYAASEL